MARVQLALNVSDLNEAIDFYYASSSAALRRKCSPATPTSPSPIPHSSWCSSRSRGPGAAASSAPSITSGSRWRRPTRSADATDRLQAGASRPRSSRRRPVASQSRTRSGSRTPTTRPGRSTPCWPTCPLSSDSRRGRDVLHRRGRRRSRRLLLTAPLGTKATAMRDVALWRRLCAEFLGSAFLALLVIGSGIAAQQLSRATPDCSSSRTRWPPGRGSSPSS